MALAATVGLLAFAGAASAQVNLGTLQVADPTSPTGTAPTKPYPKSASTPPPPEYVDGEAIVSFKAGTPAARRASANRLAGAHVVRRLLLPDTYLVRFDPGRNPRSVAGSYRRRGWVKYAEPNFVRTYDSTFPNDPAFGEQWALHNAGQTVNGAAGTNGADIGAPTAWDATQGSSSVRVGVVDTGVDYNHSDLAPNIWTNPGEIPSNGLDDDNNGVADDTRGYNFLDYNTPAKTDPMDTVGHGSHMAGIIAARGNNGIGTAGVAWDTKIVPLRVCDAVGCDDAAIADAFTYAGRTGLPVVNASLGSPSDPVVPGNVYSKTVAAAISFSSNTLFIVAAGNGGVDEVGDNVETTPSYPCSYTAANVVCVAATDSNDKLATFSDYGATSVDLAAPGQYVLGTWKRSGGQDQYAYQSGTSQATAVVTGAAALDLARGPRTVAQLRADLINNAAPVSGLAGKVASGGRLAVGPMVPVQVPDDPQGALDASFSGDGRATATFGSAACLQYATATAVQPDGKVIVVGRYCPASGNSNLGIARFRTDGTLDLTFSGDGLLGIDTVTNISEATQRQAVTLQPDGKIVVAWQTLDVSTNFAWGLARINSDGTMDSSFGSSGVVISNFGDWPYGVAVQPDGKIVVAGRNTFTAGDFTIGRFNSNGSPDTSFDGDGKVTTDFGATDDEADSVVIQPDLKIVVSGAQNFTGAAGKPEDFALARYNPNGSLDTSFDGDGKVTTDFGGKLQYPGEEAYVVKLQPSDGKIVVAGAAPDNGATPPRFALARYNTNGSLDASFDGDGKVTTPITNDGFTDNAAYGLVVQPNGKLAVAGLSRNPTTGQTDGTLMRYNADGGADTSFGTNGLLYTSFSPYFRARALGIDQQGRLIAAGYGGTDPSGTAYFVAARYANPPLLRVSPNRELNPAGASLTVEGWNYSPSALLSLQQCAGASCRLLSEPSTDGNGHLLTGASVGYTLPSGGGNCPDPTCKLVLTGPGGTAEAPISFASPTSIVTTPSRGAIFQGDAIKVGDSITASAVVTGNAGTAPTGELDFFWCGPIVIPTTCVQGGTPAGGGFLPGGAGNSGSATSDPVSFPTAGRYCFRASYVGDTLHRAATDSSKAACVAVRPAPGTGPVALDDFYGGAPNDTIADGSPGLIQNDLFGIAQVPVAQLVTGPTSGTLQGGLGADGSFTYVPNNASVTADSFTYRIQDTSGTSAPAKVSIDLTGSASVNGTRWKGTRWQGTRWKGTRWKGTSFKGTRFKGIFDAALTTYAECGSRWVWVNPEVTLYEQTYLEISAALYDANGKRIASSNFIAQGDFFGDLGEPLSIDWPVWNAPVPAGGVYAQVFVKAIPADPARPPYEIDSNVVGCQT